MRATLLIEPRVVLHRARTERIHAEIDRIVPGRHANEVTDDIDFADFGHAFEIVVALKCGGHELIERRFVDIERRQAITDAARLASARRSAARWG